MEGGGDYTNERGLYKPQLTSRYNSSMTILEREITELNCAALR
jgi:hypothetical protein